MPSDTPMNAEIEDLRSRLAEAQDALRAIRAGEVDALVVQTGAGEQVFSLESAYEPYRVFVEHMQQGAASLSADGLVLYANARFAEILGVSHTRILGTSIFDAIGETHRAVVETLLTRTTPGEADEAEIVLTRTDRADVQAYFHVTVLPDGTRCAVVTDVTERVRQRELLASEQWLRVTLSSIGDAVLSCDAAGRVTFINPVAEALTGWSRNEALGQRIQRVFSIVNEATRQPAEDIVARVLREGEPTVLANHTALVTRDGRQVSVEDSAAPIRDHDGRIAGVVIVFRDVTERRQVRLALEESEAKFRSLFEFSPDAIFVTTSDGRILSANPAACRMFGMPEEALCRAGREALIEPEDGLGQPGAEERWRHSIALNRELTFVRKNGERFPGEVSSVVLPGEASRAFVIVREITDRKRAEEALRESEQRFRASAEQLAEANRVKDDFLATLSHELRTPLNAILGWAQMLTARPMDGDTTARGLDAIVRNAQAQAQLVTDILDVSRIVSGKLRLETQPVDLVTVVYAALDAVRPAADAKRIRLATSLSLNSPIVSGDPSRLQQVVWNLLSNAVKFTPPGGEVHVAVERGDSQFSVTVRDNGGGIDPEFLPRMFERFAQADTSSKRQHGGLGLGLAIVRHLVELHGGTVEARSEGLGKGASFVVRLPVRAVGPQSHEWSSQWTEGRMDIPREVSLLGLRVLVVDDEADARDLAGTVLAAAGADVVVAGSAPEGLECLRHERFDVLLADIGMPSQDGYEFIAQVRALPPDHGGRIPAAALTAYGRADDAARALAAGFGVHLAKPTSPADLTAVVARLAGRLPDSA
jgi:PAS domain S-box-containing protein